MDQNNLEAMEKHLEELKQEQEAEITMALLLNSLDLRVFVRRNLVKGGKITAHKAVRFLLACLYPTSSAPVALPNLRELLLDVILDLMPDIVDDVENKHGFNQIMVLLSHCWEVNPEKAHRTLIQVVNTVGMKLHDHRSPFYNLLRTHFGLYGFPLELDLFVPLKELSVATTSDSANPTTAPTPSSSSVSTKSQISSESTQTAISHPTTTGPSQPVSQPSQPTQSLTGTVSTPAQVGPIFVISETKKLLEQQLLQASHDFGVKRRALTTLLEEITIAGDSYANHDRSVLSAYNDCNSAQMHYYRVFKKLKKLSPTNFEDDDDDDASSSSDEEDENDSDEDDEDDEDQVKLTRWTYIAQSLLSQLNRSEVEIDHPNDFFYDLFSHLIVFGTPLVRKEAISYLSSHLNTQVPFPATLLRMWFSKDTDSSRLINLFPHQIVFEALQEVMVQDRVRFFYVDNLFSLLEDEISLHQFEWHQYGPSSGHPGMQNDIFDLTSPRGALGLTGGHFARNLDTSSSANSSNKAHSPQHLHQSSSPTEHNFPSDFEIDESAIDVPLVSWLLLLLSNTMHRVSDNAPIHKGSKCRNCNMSPIYGVRYRCVNCVDYDLCETCESDVATRHNKLHLFLKIPAALPLPPSSFHGLPAPKEPLLPLLYKRGANASPFVTTPTLNPSTQMTPTLPLPSPSASGTGGGVSTSFFLSIMNQQKSDLQQSGLASGMLPDPHGGYMKPTPEVGPAFMGSAFSSVSATPTPISSLTAFGNGASIASTPLLALQGPSSALSIDHVSSQINIGSNIAGTPTLGLSEGLQLENSLKIPNPVHPPLNAAVLAGNASASTTPGPLAKPGPVKSPNTQASPSTVTPIAEIHRAVACDGCGRSSISGIRYKCVHCDEFNLCDACEGTVEHYPLHLFLKVRRPLPPPAHALRQQRRQNRRRKHRHAHHGDHLNAHAQAEQSGTDEIDLSKALIPVLLHHGFYPSTSYKAAVPISSPGSRVKLSKSVTDLTSFAKEESTQINAGASFLAPGAISLRSSLIEIGVDHGLKMATDSLTVPESSKSAESLLNVSASKKPPFSLSRLEELSESSHNESISAIGHLSELREYAQSPGYQVFDGRHLRSIFGVIMLSARLQTLGPELFLLAMRVLEGLTTQYTPDDIAADVFNHSHFDDFLRQVASYPSSFIRSAVLQMVDKLVNSTAYVVGKEGVHALKRIRTPLRAKAIKLLRESESAPNTASVHSSDNFLLELLLVVTSDKDIIKSDSSSTSSPADDDQYPLDSIANYLVQFLADGDDMPLGSSTAARTWCMVFRLLRFADPNHVGRIPQLTRAIRQAMTAPEELQVLLVDDFIALLTVLVSKPGLGPILQASIIGELAKAFPEAYYEDNTLAFSHAISVMYEHFTADVEFNLSDISDILQVLADALPESLPTFYPKDDPGNRMIKEVVDYLIMILSSSAFTEAHIAELIETATQQRDKAFSQLVITWLSLIEPKSKQKATAALRRDDASLKSASSAGMGTQSAMSAISFSGISTPLHPTAQSFAGEAPAKINAITIFDLGRSFTRLVKVMCTNDFVTKHFLALALASLRTKANSVLLAELCLSLIRTEDLAYHFLIELEGFDFFEDQIKNANTKFRSSFLAPAFASILSATTTAFKDTTPLSGGPSSLSQRVMANAAARQKIGYNRKPNKSNLENLSSVAELLHPRGDRQLERLLKESGAPTTSVWMHNFKPSGHRSIASNERVTFDMSMPDNVILREIRMDFVSNHNGSKFPPHVTIETGTSLSRLLPVGRFSCKPDASMYAQQASKATKHVATFKFPLPDIEVVKFVRVHIQRPKQSTWLALSRLQLLGHSSLLYNVNTSADNAAIDGSQPSLVHRLPITTCLDILEHAIGFPRVNYALALQKNNTPQFGINLLYILNKATFTSVQSIISNLAQNDTSLSDFLLNELLEGQTVYHAALAGKLCALSDSETNNRLSKLRDFVFQQVDRHTSASLSSHLVPFLDALSDAISSNIQQDSEVKCEVSHSDIKLLFQCAITAMDGSLLQKGALRLLSSLIQTDAHNYDVILAFFYSILQETLASIAEQQQEAAQASNTVTTSAPTASSLPSIVISSSESSTTPSTATAATGTTKSHVSSATSSKPFKVPFKIGMALPLPHVTSQHDIFQLFVDKPMQTIISTLGLLASSSPAASQRLMRSGLPERIVQTVRTILQIREEKQQQKAAAAQSTLANSAQTIPSSASLSFVPLAPSQTDPHRPRGEILTLQRVLEASLAFLSNMAHEQSLKTWLGENAFDLLFDLLKREHGSSLMYAAQQVFRASANLHQVNQNKIAQYVLLQLKRQQDKLSSTLSSLPGSDDTIDSAKSMSSTSVGSSDAIATQKRSSGVTASLVSRIEDLLGWKGHSVLSETTIQQLVDMFSIEDRVVLSLHPKNGAEDEVKALGPQSLAPGSLYAPTRQETIRLDKTVCNPNLELDEDMLTATASTSTSTGWRTVLADRPISAGVRRWEVVLERITTTANVMIGVCEKNHKLNAYLGQNYGGKGWSYYGATTGFTYHDGKSDSKYGQKMVQGDVIGVSLDLNEGTLSFSRNGEDLGVAFKDLASRELYPAISLYDAGDQIRFQELEGAPVDKGPLSAARIEGISPLIYQRNGPLFSLPTSTSLKSIALSLTGTDSSTSSKVVIFEFINRRVHHVPSSSHPIYPSSVSLLPQQTEDEESFMTAMSVATGRSDHGSLAYYHANAGIVAVWDHEATLNTIFERFGSECEILDVYFEIVSRSEATVRQFAENYSHPQKSDSVVANDDEERYFSDDLGRDEPDFVYNHGGRNNFASSASSVSGSDDAELHAPHTMAPISPDAILLTSTSKMVEKRAESVNTLSLAQQNGSVLRKFGEQLGLSVLVRFLESQLSALEHLDLIISQLPIPATVPLPPAPSIELPPVVAANSAIGLHPTPSTAVPNAHGSTPHHHVPTVYSGSYYSPASDLLKMAGIVGSVNVGAPALVNSKMITIPKLPSTTTASTLPTIGVGSTTNVASGLGGGTPGVVPPATPSKKAQLQTNQMPAKPSISIAIATWKHWLSLLLMQLKVKDFSTLFISNFDCRALLFKVLTDIQLDLRRYFEYLHTVRNLLVPLPAPTGLTSASLLGGNNPAMNASTQAAHSSLTAPVFVLPDNSSSTCVPPITSAPSVSGVPSVSAASSALKVASAATKIGLKIESVPPPSDESLAQPYKPLYRALITLMCTSQGHAEQGMAQRQSIFDSGVLAFVLVELVKLCDYMPRNVDHPAFQAIVALKKLQNKKKRESVAASRQKTHVHSDQPMGPAKGTGFGSDSSDALPSNSTWTPESYLKEQTAISQKTAILLECVHTFLELLIEDESMAQTENGMTFGPETTQSSSPRSRPSKSGSQTLSRSNGAYDRVNGGNLMSGATSATAESVPIEIMSGRSVDGSTRASSSRRSASKRSSSGRYYTTGVGDSGDEEASFGGDDRSSGSDGDDSSSHGAHSDSSSSSSDSDSMSSSDVSESDADMFGNMEDVGGLDSRQSKRRSYHSSVAPRLSKAVRRRKGKQATQQQRNTLARGSRSQNRRSRLSFDFEDGFQSHRVDSTTDSLEFDELDHLELMEEMWDEVIDHEGLVSQPNFPSAIYELLASSNLVSVIESHLRNDTLLDMVPHMDAYQAVIRCTNAILVHEPLVPLVIPAETHNNIFQLLSKLATMSDIILKRIPQSLFTGAGSNRPWFTNGLSRSISAAGMSRSAAGYQRRHSSHRQGTSASIATSLRESGKTLDSRRSRRQSMLNSQGYSANSSSFTPSHLDDANHPLNASYKSGANWSPPATAGESLASNPSYSYQNRRMSSDLEWRHHSHSHQGRYTQFISNSHRGRSSRSHFNPGPSASYYGPSSSHLGHLHRNHGSRYDRSGGQMGRYESRFTVPVYISPTGSLFVFGLEIDNEIRLALEWRKTWRSALFFVELFTERKAAMQDAMLSNEASKNGSPSMNAGSVAEGRRDGVQASGENPGGPLAVPRSDEEGAMGQVSDSSPSPSVSGAGMTLEEEYVRVMAQHAWGEVDLYNPEQDVYWHHFRALIKSETAPSAKKMRALVREATALASSLPLYLESSVFFRIDESRMDVMKCIITGPEDTPYAHGCFLFDIYCSNEFPSVPPQVNLQTTGNGTVRFNPNLYNCGKVCLSLLGTWRGGVNEQWNEATTTLLQVFVSIQSLIFVSQPFFNEPGYETLMNTTKGDLQSAAYNETIRLATITYAMLDPLKNPPLGFEQVVKLHFSLKANRVMKDATKWLQESGLSSPDFFARLKANVLELKDLLLQLNPDAMDGITDPQTIQQTLTFKADKPADSSSPIPPLSPSSSAPIAEIAFHPPTAPIGDDGYMHPMDIYPHLAQKPK